nr:hypothetical protein [Ktedonobacteraceae bacterium]
MADVSPLTNPRQRVPSSMVGEPHPGDDEGPFTGTLGWLGLAFPETYNIPVPFVPYE